MGIRFIGQKFIKDLENKTGLCWEELIDRVEYATESDHFARLSEEVLLKFKRVKHGNSDMDKIPEFIYESEVIEELIFHCNKIELISDKIGKLINLKVLSLNHNKLTILPKTIGNLQNLEILKLDNNKIKILPDEIEKLLKLRELELSNNDLFSLNDSFTKLISLENLSIQNNKLRELSEDFGCLEQLKTLSLHNNCISCLPNSIGNLKNLEVFDLTKNNINFIPDSIVELKKLKRLYLHMNNILNFPNDFKKLENLEILNIDFSLLNNLKEPISTYTDANITVWYDGSFFKLQERFKKELVCNWKAHWLLDTKNIQERTFLIQVLGYEKILSELNSELLHKEIDRFGNSMELFRVDRNIDIEAVLLLKVSCPSTGKIHILRVPPNMRNCEEARRWTFFDLKNTFNFIEER